MSLYACLTRLEDTLRSRQDIEGYRNVRRVRYKFHYQRADGTLIFRYDNAPHHPGLSTFPHHKHVGNSIVPAEAPDLSEVLREIDTLIYSEPEKP